MYGVGNDWRSTDLPGKSSTKVLLSELFALAKVSIGSEGSVAYVVFDRIHHQFEPVFDFKLAIDRGKVISQSVLAHIQMNCNLLIC